jgi:hypothetical protein
MEIGMVMIKGVANKIPILAQVERKIFMTVSHYFHCWRTRRASLTVISDASTPTGKKRAAKRRNSSLVAASQQRPLANAKASADSCDGVNLALVNLVTEKALLNLQNGDGLGETE